MFRTIRISEMVELMSYIIEEFDSKDWLHLDAQSKNEVALFCNTLDDRGSEMS